MFKFINTYLERCLKFWSLSRFWRLPLFSGIVSIVVIVEAKTEHFMIRYYFINFNVVKVVSRWIWRQEPSVVLRSMFYDIVTVVVWVVALWSVDNYNLMSLCNKLIDLIIWRTYRAIFAVLQLHIENLRVCFERVAWQNNGCWIINAKHL